MLLKPESYLNKVNQFKPLRDAFPGPTRCTGGEEGRLGRCLTLSGANTTPHAEDNSAGSSVAAVVQISV